MRGNKKGERKEETEGGPMTEEGPPAPEDDDLNISYNCETCNKPVKGKVMLQVDIITNILCLIAFLGHFFQTLPKFSRTAPSVPIFWALWACKTL